jgi:carbamoyl-phosphate synthase large subunit
VSQLNVLITAASRRVALVDAFLRAVANSGGGRVIVTDVNALSPAVYRADRAYRVPISSAPSYIDEVLAIALAERVSLIVPTIDDELTTFAEAARRFEREGIRVAVSPPETTAMCNDKYATCRTLRAKGVAAARSYLRDEVPVSATFPLFIKPRFGRGGVQAYLVRNARELEFFLDYVEDPVVQEYLPGAEFTIDVLCDFQGRPLSIVPRERVVIRSGVIDRGRTVKDESLIRLAQSVAAVVRCVGAVNIQCRMVDGQPVVFEINPRFSGGIPLTIRAGADFPGMLIDLARGRRLAPRIGLFHDQLWMTSYESSVFLEASEVRLDALRPAGVGEVA